MRPIPDGFPEQQLKLKALFWRKRTCQSQDVKPAGLCLLFLERDDAVQELFECEATLTTTDARRFLTSRRLMPAASAVDALLELMPGFGIWLPAQLALE